MVSFSFREVEKPFIFSNVETFHCWYHCFTFVSTQKAEVWVKLTNLLNNNDELPKLLPSRGCENVALQCSVWTKVEGFMVWGAFFFFTKRRCFRRHIDGISFKYSKQSNFLLLILRRAFVSFMPFPQQPKGNWCE